MESNEHSVVPKPERRETDAELIAKLDTRRDELLEAAGVLRTPLRTVNRADSIIRHVLPILPYAITAVTLIGVAGSLIRGRRVRPTILLATGLDVWRIWKTYKAGALMSSAKPAVAASH